MKAQWLEIAPKLTKFARRAMALTLDAVMDLVFEIEQQTQAICGTPDGSDQALLLLSQDRGGVER